VSRLPESVIENDCSREQILEFIGTLNAERTGLNELWNPRFP